MDMLKSSGFGCYVGNVFAGGLAYADDIVLTFCTGQVIETVLSIF